MTTDPDHTTDSNGSRPDLLTMLLATGFGTGLIRPAPGTWGSLLGIPLAWWMKQAVPQPILYLAVIAVLFTFGSWICSRYEALSGGHDPAEVVIDEIVAMPLAFLFCPFSPKSAVLGFLCFRLFDISKPWPIRALDRIKGGMGVMLDDQLAGLFAGVAVWAMLRAWM